MLYTFCGCPKLRNWGDGDDLFKKIGAEGGAENLVAGRGLRQ